MPLWWTIERRKYRLRSYGTMSYAGLKSMIFAGLKLTAGGPKVLWKTTVADGRLLSLVEGIREGRQIAQNLRQAIVYLLTASFGTTSIPPYGP